MRGRSIIVFHSEGSRPNLGHSSPDEPLLRALGGASEAKARLAAVRIVWAKRERALPALEAFLALDVRLSKHPRY